MSSQGLPKGTGNVDQGRWRRKKEGWEESVTERGRGKLDVIY